MELLLLVFFCLLTGSEVTFGAENGGSITDRTSPTEVGDEIIRGTKVIKVKEGSDVTLPCSLNTTDITNKKFEWKKDDRQVFLYDAGDHSNNVNTGQDQQFVRRVSYFLSELKSGNASITISNTMVADTGKYTCDFTNHPGEIFLVVLIVERDIPDRGIPDEIIGEVIKKTTVITVKEGSDVTLRCSLREDITNKKFVWKKDGRQVFLYDTGDHSNNANTGQDQLFRGRVEYFLSELKSGNASITIRNMKVTDTGKYTCDFTNHPGEIFLIVLFVVGGSITDIVREEIKGYTDGWIAGVVFVVVFGFVLLLAAVILMVRIARQDNNEPAAMTAVTAPTAPTAPGNGPDGLPTNGTDGAGLPLMTADSRV